MYFNADAYYQEDRIAICICGTSHSFMFGPLVDTARAGTLWMGTVVKTCYKWMI